MKVHTKLLHSVYDQCIQLVTKKKELDYNLVFNKYYYQIIFRALNFTRNTEDIENCVSGSKPFSCR